LKSLGRQELYCHLSKDESDRRTNSDIRHSNAKLITSYSNLVEELAKIAYYNPGFSFFYRGQEDDYSTLYKGTKRRKSSSMYPTIFRSPGRSLRSSLLKIRYEKLNLATKKVIMAFKKAEFSSHDRMRKFPELAWTVLQHYGVCSTPLLDVTHSARVAASFGLPENSPIDGYFYVLALPHPNEGVSYSVDNELVTLKLLNVCPPQAKRPFFQEGYLVGNFPHHVERKRAEYDLAVRLVAKYRLKGRKFWSDSFPFIPSDSLSPKIDEVKDICERIKGEIEDNEIIKDDKKKHRSSA